MLYAFILVVAWLEMADVGSRLMDPVPAPPPAAAASAPPATHAEAVAPERAEPTSRP